MKIRKAAAHPARLLPIAFLTLNAVGTGLLMLPWSTASGESPPLVTAMFTATSAATVTGLTHVDTATYWSGFGHVVILGLFQVGGFGVMTLATFLGLVVMRRMGMRSRLVAQAETHVLAIGDVTSILKRIALVTVTVEFVTAVVLAVRFATAYEDDVGEAVWHGVFHSVSAFNSAGFALHSDSVVRFAYDPYVLVPLMIAVIIGGFGFPVLAELLREYGKPAAWSVHTKITIVGSVILLVGGTSFFLVSEWANPRTMGQMDVSAKILNSAFHSSMTRSGGFNAFDISALHDESLAVTDGLMFIGGGSAGTSGGIKVTTFFLLFFVIVAEVRGETDVVAFRRRISSEAQRLAITVALLGVGFVAGGTIAMLALTEYPMEQSMFEVISAFGTTGLSTGITAHLPDSALVLLVVLMFVGRVGTITMASALALRAKDRRYRYPEERPIVG